MSSSKLNNSPNIFQSTGIKKKNNHLRASKRLQTVVDDRLKRFRMLDPDEFQEMLNSWSHQVPDHPIKELDSMDTIGGMQLESRRDLIRVDFDFSSSPSRLLVAQIDKLLFLIFLRMMSMDD